MEEEIFLMLGEGFDEYEEEMEEMDADSSGDEDDESSSDKSTGWESLPTLCLMQVFRCLSDRDRMSAALVCRQWHYAMHSPCLWRTRIFHFSGSVSSKSAIFYARSLGRYLENLSVYVSPPYKPAAAQRVERNISTFLSEIRRVNAPLTSLCIPMMRLGSWPVRLRMSLVQNLKNFLLRGSSRLTSLCLNGMRNSVQHGLDLLHALSCHRRHHNSRYIISSLEIIGFFQGHLEVHLNKEFPKVIRPLRGLTYLSLSYAYLSDNLLSVLQFREPGCEETPNTLQSISLYCSDSESHRQLVSGASWAALTSRCPDLKVELVVDEIVNIDSLARIMLPEIPLVNFTMKAFYSVDEDWSAAPVLSNLLPQYSRSLKRLSLDLCDSGDCLDEELLELVTVLQCLEQLRVRAFLEIISVGRLLHSRQNQRSTFKNIKMKIYSLFDDVNEQEEQLEQIVSSYEKLLPDVECCITVFPLLDT